MSCKISNVSSTLESARRQSLSQFIRRHFQEIQLRFSVWASHVQRRVGDVYR